MSIRAPANHPFVEPARIFEHAAAHRRAGPDEQWHGAGRLGFVVEPLRAEIEPAETHPVAVLVGTGHVADRRVHSPDRRVLELADERFPAPRLHGDVRVGKDEDITRRRSRTGIACAGNPDFGGPDHARGVVRGEEIHRAVTGPVVHDNDFAPGRQRPIEVFDGLPKAIPFVERDDDDANQWSLPPEERPASELFAEGGKIAH